MATRTGRLGGKNIDFTSGPIIKQIVAFSIPALLGNVFNALYNVVDTIVVGQFKGANALAAVGSCFSITMVCVAVYAGFGMGSGILTAQMFGAKRQDQLTATVNTAYIGGFFVGTTMIIVGELLAVPLLRLLNTPAEIMEMATSYLRIYLLGSTGQLFYFMGSNMLRGLGDSKWPTYALILCAILNTVLDLVFVIVLDWGVAGVAAATVLAQLISGIAVVIRIYRGSYGITFSRKTFRIDFGILKMILAIGIPGALDRLVTSIGTMIIQAFSNSFGPTLVATNSILQKVEQFALMPTTALGTALRMFVGQNMGAGNDDRTKEGIKKVSGVIVVIGLVVGLICMAFARVLCRAFVSEEAVINMGIEAIRLTGFFYVFHAVQMASSSVLNGAGATRSVMYFSFIGIASRVVLCYLLAMLTGRWQGLFWATNSFYVITAALYTIYVWKGNWKKYVKVRRAS